MTAPRTPTGWAALLTPYDAADLTPLPAAAPPPSERTRARLLDSPHRGDAAWADVLLGAGLEWAEPPSDDNDNEGDR